MRSNVVALSLLLASLAPAAAQAQVGVDVRVGLPGVSIGLDVPAYPELVQVPGYPVYYDPRASANYFYFDGQYWVFSDDRWYASDWYNGPWQFVAPEYVPAFVLRVPVRYYRRPPAYFRGWRADDSPRWGHHWGHEWERHRAGWDRWDRRASYRPAPLPVYQRQYAGDRYPRAPEQQRALHAEHGFDRPRGGDSRGHGEAEHDRGRGHGEERGGERGRDDHDRDEHHDRH